MHTIYLALGTNIGNRYNNILTAANLLHKSDINIIDLSSLYETRPYGFYDQPNFFNLVLKCNTNHTPEQILYKIKQIEKELGRQKTIRWGARIIDIDILLFDNLVIKSEDLNIPHIELKKRDFFMIPLLEIDNNIIDPITNLPLKYFLSPLKPHILNSVSINSDFHKIISY